MSRSSPSPCSISFSSLDETQLNPGKGTHRIAGLWEITIKVSLGKLELADNWLNSVQQELTSNNIHWLPIDVAHCTILETLPFHHRDPFDRMLVAQAITEKMAIMSNDARMQDYPLTCI